jgi:hypothetical protein
MEDKIFSSDRPFRVWDYLVSHDQLLLRSAKIKGFERNIDVIFFGVSYIQLHTVLSGVTISKIDPPDEEVAYESIKKYLKHEGNKLFQVASANERYLIVAAFVRVFENALEFDETSLGFTELGRENEITAIN